MVKLFDYFKNSFFEFRNNVSWPKWKELQSATIVVVVGTILLALVLAGIDFVVRTAILQLF